MENEFTAVNAAFLKFLERLARESGRIIARYWQTGFTVESKADATPVTIADRLAEEKLRGLIGREFPRHGVIGEEFGETNPGAEYVWILDPIDGTKSFVAGVPLFGTLIALLRNGEPLVGVISNPILGFFLCGDNRRALCNGRPAACRPCASLSEATLSTTSPLSSVRHPQGRNFTRLAEQVKLYRAWGDCYGYYLLATGRIDERVAGECDRADVIGCVRASRGAAGGVVVAGTVDEHLRRV